MTRTRTAARSLRSQTFEAGRAFKRPPAEPSDATRSLPHTLHQGIRWCRHPSRRGAGCPPERRYGASTCDDEARCACCRERDTAGLPAHWGGIGWHVLGPSAEVPTTRCRALKPLLGGTAWGLVRPGTCGPKSSSVGGPPRKGEVWRVRCWTRRRSAWRRIGRFGCGRMGLDGAGPIRTKRTWNGCLPGVG